MNRCYFKIQVQQQKMKIIKQCGSRAEIMAQHSAYLILDNKKNCAKITFWAFLLLFVVVCNQNIKKNKTCFDLKSQIWSVYTYRLKSG